jgi:hypothetical protein
MSLQKIAFVRRRVILGVRVGGGVVGRLEEGWRMKKLVLLPSLASSFSFFQPQFQLIPLTLLFCPFHHTTPVTNPTSIHKKLIRIYKSITFQFLACFSHCKQIKEFGMIFFV